SDGTPESEDRERIRRVLYGRANHLLVVGLSMALGASLASQWHGVRPLQAQTAAPRPSLAPEQKHLLRTLQDSFATIAESAEPFVVTISARAAPPQRTDPAPHPSHPP